MTVCIHTEALNALIHDTYSHRIYGTCEACEMAQPMKCICGYEACCGIDADEHLTVTIDSDLYDGEKHAII